MAETILIEVKGDSSGLSKALKEAGVEVKKFEKTTGDASGATRNWKAEVDQLTNAVGVNLAKGALLGGAVAAIGAFAKSSVEAAGQAKVAETAFINLSGGVEQATENFDAVARATTVAGKQVVDETTRMQIANQLLGMGIANTAGELEKTIGTAVRLGGAFKGLGAREAADDFALMISNMSVARLDSFGISSGKVRTRIDELMSSVEGMTREQAFFQATMEEADVVMSRLGEQVSTVKTSTDAAAASWADFQGEFGKAALALGDGAGAFDAIISGIDKLTQGAEAWQQNIQTFKDLKSALDNLSPAFDTNIDKVVEWAGVALGAITGAGGLITLYNNLEGLLTAGATAAIENTVGMDALAESYLSSARAAQMAGNNVDILAEAQMKNQGITKESKDVTQDYIDTTAARWTGLAAVSTDVLEEMAQGITLTAKEAGQLANVTEIFDEYDQAAQKIAKANQELAKERAKTAKEISETTQEYERDIANHHAETARQIEQAQADHAQRRLDIEKQMVDATVAMQDQIAEKQAELQQKLIETNRDFLERRNDLQKQINEEAIGLEEELGDIVENIEAKKAQIQEKFALKSEELAGRRKQAVVDALAAEEGATLASVQAQIDQAKKYLSEKEGLLNSEGELTQEQADRIMEIDAWLNENRKVARAAEIEAQKAELEAQRQEELAGLEEQKNQEIVIAKEANQKRVADLRERIAQEYQALQEQQEQIRNQNATEVESIREKNAQTVANLQERIAQEEEAYNTQLAEIQRRAAEEDVTLQENHDKQIERLTERLAEQESAKEQEIAQQVAIQAELTKTAEKWTGAIPEAVQSGAKQWIDSNTDILENTRQFADLMIAQYARIAAARNTAGTSGGGGTADAYSRTRTGQTQNRTGNYQGRQHGGPVRSGQPYMVGETGPELFIPSVGGSIVSNKNMTGNLSIGNITLNGVNDPQAMFAAIQAEARKRGMRFVPMN